MSVCRSCQAEIEWVTLGPSGKRMPIDPDPVEDGNVFVEKVASGWIGEVLKDGDPYDGERYVSHFATCPDAKEHRR